MTNLVFYEEYTYTDYAVFVSSLKQELKRKTPKEFVDSHNTQPNLYMHAKILYLVSVIEYLCKHNNLERPDWVYKYRDGRMEKVLFSEGALLYYMTTNDISKLEEDYNNCIPEFKHHNLVETSLNNVF